MRRSSGIRRAKRVIGQAIEALESRRLLSTTLFSANFESSGPVNGGFTLSPASPNLWHTSNLAAQSGVASMYYGQESTINYDTGAANSGAIVSPTISLVGHTAANLRFRYYLYTDAVEDIAEVDITTNGGTSWTPLASNVDGSLVDAPIPPATPQDPDPVRADPSWALFTASLNTYVGNNVQLRFMFNTVDNIANDYTGWFVDDVVVADPGTTPAPEITAITPDYGSTITSTSTTIGVTFNEAVQGVDATDLVLTNVAGAQASVTGVTYAGNNTYNFSVSGLTSGVLTASLAQTAGSITDTTGQTVLPAIQKFIVLLPDRFEPNNSFAAASDLGRIGGVHLENNLTLDTSTDMDYFKFTPDGTGTTTVSISCPWILADVDLYIYDGSQNLVGSSATFNDTETVSFTGTMGQTYYVEAVSPVGDTTYNYSLSITAPAVPPTVTGVFVRGTAWSTSFMNYLSSKGYGDSTLGYAIPVGSGAQLKSLPWNNINRISVKFSEGVSANAADLALTGRNTATYDLSGATFSYDPATFVATWTLAGSSVFSKDKLMVSLNADGTNPVVDLAGIRLDGEFTNPTTLTQTGTSVYPSGNGSAGGNFNFRFNVLPGDVNQNNLVQANDGLLARNLSGTTTASANYSLMADINANGLIQSNDGLLARNASGSSLPSGDPLPPVFA